MNKEQTDACERYIDSWSHSYGTVNDVIAKEQFRHGVEFAQQPDQLMLNPLVKNLVEALKKTIKENTAFLYEFDCKKDGHCWEPDTSLTIMRCEVCGIGANTHEAREALAPFGKWESDVARWR